MSLSDLDVEQSYTGNGSNQDFAINFSYQLAAQVKVSLDGVDQPSGWSIVSTNVHFSVAPTTGVVVRVYRSTPLTQTLNLIDSGSFLQEDLEAALDRIVMQIQEVKNALDNL